MTISFLASSTTRRRARPLFAASLVDGLPMIEPCPMVALKPASSIDDAPALRPISRTTHALSVALVTTALVTLPVAAQTPSTANSASAVGMITSANGSSRTGSSTTMPAGMSIGTSNAAAGAASGSMTASSAGTPAAASPAAAGSVVTATTADPSVLARPAAASVRTAARRRTHHIAVQRVRADGPDGSYSAQAAPNDTSLVRYDYDEDYSYPVSTVRGQQTHIEFAPGEEILGVFFSEPTRWIYAVAKSTKRDLFIEPRQANLSNPATVITTKHRYELNLTSTERGTRFARVKWNYPDALDAGNDVGGLSNSLGVEYARAPGRAGASAAPGTGVDDGVGIGSRSSTRIDLTRAHFDWRVEGDAPFAPTMVFDDGRSLYLRLPRLAEQPAIFVFDANGHAELASWVQLPDAPDYYRITQMPTYGLLMVGKGKSKEVRIFNRHGGGCGLFGCRAAKIENFDTGDGSGS